MHVVARFGCRSKCLIGDRICARMVFFVLLAAGVYTRSHTSVNDVCMPVVTHEFTHFGMY